MEGRVAQLLSSLNSGTFKLSHVRAKKLLPHLFPCKISVMRAGVLVN
jgi:hypothetical protein